MRWEKNRLRNIDIEVCGVSGSGVLVEWFTKQPELPYLLRMFKL